MVISDYITPVMFTDSTGEFPEWLNPANWSNETKLIVGVVLIAALAVATIATGGAAGGVAGYILSGALNGAITGAVSGGLISGAISGISTGTWQGFADGFANGFLAGAAIGGVTGAASNAYKLANAAKSWNGGTKSMISHFENHGIKMGFKNPVEYTRAANNIIKSGKYVIDKNAYVSLIQGNKYFFVGINQAGTHITTFGIRTFTKTVVGLLGLS